MDQNRIKGACKRAAGEVKEVTGQALGNEKLRLKGRADQVAGAAQSTFGRVKDLLRGRRSGI